MAVQQFAKTGKVGSTPKAGGGGSSDSDSSSSDSSDSSGSISAPFLAFLARVACLSSCLRPSHLLTLSTGLCLAHAGSSSPPSEAFVAPKNALKAAMSKRRNAGFEEDSDSSDEVAWSSADEDSDF